VRELRYAGNFAKCEPTNRVFWMAEAENWSRLSNEKLRGEPEQKSISVTMHSLNIQAVKGRGANV
jgi:hypothetical protein